MQIQFTQNSFNQALRSCLLATGLASISIIILFISGCATQAPVEETVVEESKQVWPAPPEQARIRHLGSIHSLGDISKKQKLSLSDTLLGKEQEEDILNLSKPYAVYSDSKGRLFITDNTARGLIVFDLEKKKTTFWGQSGLGALSAPRGVTADANGNVYVSDPPNHNVVVFDNDGKFLKAYGGEDVLTHPVGMVFNEVSQQLYVVDTKQHAIVVFNERGDVDFTIGQRGSAGATFNFPTNITIDANGLLYVADSMNFRIQVLESDGTFIRYIGKLGNVPGTMARLKGVGTDSEGHIYAVDAAFNNFQIFNQQGNLLLFIGVGGNGPADFSLPAGMHVDKNDHIFIADQLNQRIQMFEYLGESATDPSLESDQ